MPASGDLFNRTSDTIGDEFFEKLLLLDGLKIERIVSNGQSTPVNEWYDQDWNEWVLLVSGEALMRLEHEVEVRHLRAGNWLLLPAHCRHRVEWTLPGQETIWLALHWPFV